EPASQVAELLLELFPASRVIFLLRDGRDVVDSWVDGYRDGTWAHQGGAYPVSDEGRLALIRWQAAVWLRRTELMQRSFAEIEPANRILIRYEDLREEPAAALEDTCELFGIELARSQLRAVANANVYERVPSGEKGEGREIRRAMPGGWRENMSPVEIDAMHEILAGKLVELSYLNEGEGIEPTSLAERGSKGPRAA
ncbi:MAG: sulfotransferase, partial [Actinomycetota bacterium]|nr:sulfotransferase [Actinomycetota bacterium]